MLNKIKILLSLLITPALLTGCWDKVEPEERGFVTAVGIDKSGKDGFSISLEVPSPSAFEESGMGESSGEEEKENPHVESEKGANIWDTIKQIDSSFERKLNFGQTKVCVIGEKILKDKTLFKETIDALERNKEIGRRLIVTATEGKAEKILNSYSGEQKTAGLFISTFYNNNTKNTDSTFSKDLQGILGDLSAAGNTIIPKVSASDGKINLEGMAIINNYSLSGWLNKEEVSGYMLLKEDMIGTDITTEYNGESVPMRISKKTADIELKENGNKIICYIEVDINGSVEEYSKGDIPLNNLQKSYEETVSGIIKNNFELFQKDLQTDVLNLRELCRKKHYDIYLKYKDDWDNAFSEMELKDSISVRISGTGTIK